MLAWFVDNANVVYVILGIIALALGVSWWLNRRVKTLMLVGVVVAFMAIFWLMTTLIPTDRKQIVDNIWAMRRAVLERKPDDLAKHLAADFAFQGINRNALAQELTKKAADFDVNDIHLFDFDVKSVAAEKAEIWFRCRAGARDGRPMLALCKTDFVMDGAAWKLHRIRFFQPIANTDQEITLPLGR